MVQTDSAPALCSEHIFLCYICAAFCGSASFECMFMRTHITYKIMYKFPTGRGWGLTCIATYRTKKKKTQHWLATRPSRFALRCSFAWYCYTCLMQETLQSKKGDISPSLGTHSGENILNKYIVFVMANFIGQKASVVQYRRDKISKQYFFCIMESFGNNINLFNVLGELSDILQ